MPDAANPFCPPFRSLAEVFSEPLSGADFAVELFEVSAEEVYAMRVREAINRRGEYADFEAGHYVRLVGPGGAVIMSDTPMERRTNMEVVRRANGRVLIAGLGLGMILFPILAKPDVAEVLVVEASGEVIDLVRPVLVKTLPHPEKLTVVPGDIFHYRPSGRWDTVYFDIWPDINADNYAGMTRLHRSFGRRLNRENPAAWMGSWRRQDCRARRR